MLKERWGRVEEHYWKLDNKSLKIFLEKSGFELIKKNNYGLFPMNPKKLSSIGFPDKLISTLLNLPYNIITDEELDICKKTDDVII